MKRIKILIVSKAFYPILSPRSHRATELAKEFARQGHHVTVLTNKDPEQHPIFETENNITIKDLGTPRWKSPDFGKSKTGYFMTRLFYRLLSLAFEYPSIELMFLVNKALKRESENDLIISIAVPYPIHWGVALSWNKKKPIANTWVADCGDPFLINPVDTFQKPFYFKYINNWFLRKTDFVTIPAESARPGYPAKFQNKIRIIPQGFQFEGTTTHKEFIKNDIPSFAYAGGFIPKFRDPRPFLDYLSSLPDDFRFYIFTKSIDLIKPYEKKSDNKIIIMSYIERNELLTFLSKMDFLVNIDNNTNLVVPSKLIDYALTGRPILNIKKELDVMIIDQFLSGDYSQKMAIENLAQYNISSVTKQFISLIDSNI
jgi:hypothetical protein